LLDGSWHFAFVPIAEVIRSKQHLYSITRLREQPTPLGRAGELDELFS
jgi:hypothetical protein